MKNFTLLLCLSFASFATAQEVAVSIDVGASPTPGKQQVNITYTATGGSFQGNNGTDEWNAQTITLGWTSGGGMTPSAPNSNTDITSFNTPTGFSFVDNFTASTNIISYTLDQLGGAADGNIYTTFVVNGSTSNQPMAEGINTAVFTFDIPSTWSGSIFLLENQPGGIPIGVAPVILNSVLGQVWDTAPASAMLPIELLSFNAKPLNGTDAKLNWVTSSEQNSDRFEVERSADGKSWELAGKLEAAGNSISELGYELIDRGVYDPSQNTNNIFYYRLKMFDLDGSFQFSEVRKVEFEKIGGLFIGELFPNPASREISHIFLPVETGIFTEMKVSLFDVSGKVLWRYDYEVEIGQTDLALEYGSLPSGTYFFQINAGLVQEVRRFVVQ